MSSSVEEGPVAVPEGAKRTGDARGRWPWVEPSVWTERMLTALEQGVRGGRWFSLIDKVSPESTLGAASRQVAANRGAAGVDHVTVATYEGRLEENLKRLSERLRDGTYRPQAIRRHHIPKPGSREERPLGIPTVQDRVVQTALRMVLEPIFEREFAEHSYGFRPGRGCKDALRRVDELLKAGSTVIVDADLKGYFDTIPHDRLLALIRRGVSDGRVLSLIEAFLKQGVLDGLCEWTPTQGSPQGAVVSPLLSNIYLDPLDHLMAREGLAMVRYADDFLILCRSPEEAATALAIVRRWTAEAGLTLHPTKTRIVNSREESFAFLGYSFRGRFRFPREKSHQKFTDRLKELTPRNSGESLKSIIQQLNQVLRGWFGYFRHCFWNIFGDYDSRLRERLRATLAKRERRNPERLPPKQRWPNSYFAEQGLLSLQESHLRLVQSIQGNY